MPIGPDLILVLVIVLVIVLLWRGPKTLPGLGTAFGQAVKGARDAMHEVTGDQEGDNPATSSEVAAAVATPPAAVATPPAVPAPPISPPSAPAASAPETTPPPSAGPPA
jgi:Sec-independent protein translocase protein TatA